MYRHEVSVIPSGQRAAVDRRLGIVVRLGTESFHYPSLVQASAWPIRDWVALVGCFLLS